MPEAAADRGKPREPAAEAPTGVQHRWKPPRPGCSSIMLFIDECRGKISNWRGILAIVVLRHSHTSRRIAKPCLLTSASWGGGLLIIGGCMPRLANRRPRATHRGQWRRHRWTVDARLPLP